MTFSKARGQKWYWEHLCSLTLVSFFWQSKMPKYLRIFSFVVFVVWFLIKYKLILKLLPKYKKPMKTKFTSNPWICRKLGYILQKIVYEIEVIKKIQHVFWYQFELKTSKLEIFSKMYFNKEPFPWLNSTEKVAFNIFLLI